MRPLSACGPAGPRWPFNARFAFALISTVWIVPFLMFLLVTTNAAVADAAETNIATIAAMIALFTMTPSPVRPRRARHAGRRSTAHRCCRTSC
jgi:hypothetical protein